MPGHYSGSTPGLCSWVYTWGHTPGPFSWVYPWGSPTPSRSTEARAYALSLTVHHTSLGSARRKKESGRGQLLVHEAVDLRLGAMRPRGGDATEPREPRCSTTGSDPRHTRLAALALASPRRSTTSRLGRRRSRPHLRGRFVRTRLCSRPRRDPTPSRRRHSEAHSCDCRPIGHIDICIPLCPRDRHNANHSTRCRCGTRPRSTRDFETTRSTAAGDTKPQVGDNATYDCFCAVASLDADAVSGQPTRPHSGHTNPHCPSDLRAGSARMSHP